MNEFILASQSPRRRELLKNIGLKFEVIVSEADEGSVSSEGIAPSLYVQELALIKAAATAKKVFKNKKAVVDILRIKDGYTVCNNVKTDVYFKPLTAEKIRAYINTHEPSDKAGAYGIQGMGGLLVEKIDGDYANVVGLPVSALADTLEKEFDINIL